MTLQKNAILRHIGIKTGINPRFPGDFNKRNLDIPFKQMTWQQIKGKKRIAMVNNFGAAGGKTMIVLKKAPLRSSRQVDPRSTFVVAVSAKNEGSSAANMENLIK